MEVFSKFPADTGPEAFFTADLDLLCIAEEGGTIFTINGTWKRELGYTPEELNGKDLLDYVHLDDRAVTREALGRSDSPDSVSGFTSRLRRSDGTYRHIEWRMRRLGQLIFASGRDITERVVSEERTRTLLAEKDLRLREVHHRMKNTLNTVGSFLALQARQAESRSEALALQEAQNRVRTFHQLYERLNVQDDSQFLSIRDYLVPLVDGIVNTFPGCDGVTPVYEVTDVLLDIRTLSRIGLIVNELVTNAVKHALSAPSADGCSEESLSLHVSTGEGISPLPLRMGEGRFPSNRTDRPTRVKASGCTWSGRSRRNSAVQ